MAAGQGQARSSKVKQGQARSSKAARVRSLKGVNLSSVWRGQTRLKRQGKFSQMVRKIYAKWQGKFKPNLAKPKSFF
ncbi:TPA: hypothetical protein R1X61_000284 [Campylobacter upsaliensis]|nr:hypothetical protein [Campylobacter upsaliensis]